MLCVYFELKQLKIIYLLYDLRKPLYTELYILRKNKGGKGGTRLIARSSCRGGTE